MTTRQSYRVVIDVDVFDKIALYNAAKKYAIEQDNMTQKGACQLLWDRGAPNVNACLQMLLDPGVSPDGASILGSDCE